MSSASLLKKEGASRREVPREGRKAPSEERDPRDEKEGLRKRRIGPRK